MERITWSKFHSLNAQEIESGPCLEVTFNEMISVIVVIRPQQGMLDQTRGICSYIDAAKGNPPLPEKIATEPVLGPWEVLTPNDADGNPVDRELIRKHAERRPTVTLEEDRFYASQG